MSNPMTEYRSIRTQTDDQLLEEFLSDPSADRFGPVDLRWRRRSRRGRRAGVGVLTGLRSARS